MQNSLTIKKGITLVKEGNKIVTYVRPGTKGRTLKNLLTKKRASVDLAKQVLTTVAA